MCNGKQSMVWCWELAARSFLQRRAFIFHMYKGLLPWEIWAWFDCAAPWPLCWKPTYSCCFYYWITFLWYYSEHYSYYSPLFSVWAECFSRTVTTGADTFRPRDFGTNKVSRPHDRDLYMNKHVCMYRTLGLISCVLPLRSSWDITTDMTLRNFSLRTGISLD